MSRQNPAVETAVATERRAQRARSWRRATSHPGLVFGAVVFLALLALSFIGPLLNPFDPLAVEGRQRLLAPSAEHWLGTDTFGRDVLSRIMSGGQISVLVGTGVALFAGVAGTVIGLYSAFNRVVDSIAMRFMDGILAFPAMLLAIAVTAALGPSLPSLIVSLGIVFTPIIARVARASALSVKSQTYVEALIAQGARRSRILWLDVLPNAISPVIVQVTFVFADALLVEAALSFMGVGVNPPAPSWGNMLLEGKSVIYTSWWLVVFPGIAIGLMVLCVNLFGDSLRDLLDPRQRGVVRRPAFGRKGR